MSALHQEFVRKLFSVRVNTNMKTHRILKLSSFPYPLSCAILVSWEFGTCLSSSCIDWGIILLIGHKAMGSVREAKRTTAGIEIAWRKQKIALS